jgi:hypothetical protein
MKQLLIVIAAATVAGGALAQTKWDLPSGYGANTFQVQNLVQFSEGVDKATAGKLEHRYSKPTKSNVQCNLVKPLWASLFCLVLLTKPPFLGWTPFHFWPPATLMQNG